MALKTLEHVKEIGGFNVIVMDKLRKRYPDKFNESGSMDYEWFEKEIRPTNFIYVRNDVNSLSFTLQNGPIKENGINGCQVDTIIESAKLILKGLNKNIPSIYTSSAILSLEEALDYLEQRTSDRIRRGVEGYEEK